jgi:hypothetical protein
MDGIDANLAREDCLEVGPSMQSLSCSFVSFVDRMTTNGKERSTKLHERTRIREPPALYKDPFGGG